MSTKAEIVNDAYTQLRISGLTAAPTPADLVLGLNELENMMAEFYESWNMDPGYNFEATPDINSQTNVPRAHRNMMTRNLAVRLIPAFNKPVPQQLERQASSTFSSSLGRLQAQNLRQVQPSTRMPRGSGNMKGMRWNRFQRPVNLPPNESATHRIEDGETQSYFEDFSAWLGSNTIASYTIAADPRLTVSTSANADPRITYTVSASASESYGPWQYVKITVTDSAGRVEIRLISFELYPVPTVPSP